MSGSRIKLDGELLSRCRKQAEQLGYSSVEEFSTHVLASVLSAMEGTGGAPAADEEEIANRLKGLGYIEYSDSPGLLRSRSEPQSDPPWSCSTAH